MEFELEGKALEPQRCVEAPDDHHHLQVGQRVLLAQNLQVELVELSEAAGLGAVVPEDGANRVEFDRLRADVHPVLNVGPDDACGELRPQGQGIATFVGKGVHFLLHDIGGGPDTTGEEIRGLKDGDVYPLKASLAGQPDRARSDILPVGLVLRENVLGPGRALEARHKFLLSGFASQLYHRPGFGNLRLS